MKVLMFGWEFPPFHSGGLGTACYGLTKGLARKGADITFVLPQIAQKAKAEFVRIISAGTDFKMHCEKTAASAYMTAEEYRAGKKGIYGSNLFDEAQRYAMKAYSIAKTYAHDVIHAHDWMTYMAGINARKASGKPLVVHVHATELDRTGGNSVNQHVYEIERKGMHEADMIIAVSNFTKNKIIEHYGIRADKIHVVHNAVDFNEHKFRKEEFGIRKGSNVVLFLGRMTLQKGPDYFLSTAKRIIEVEPNVTFIMAGSGDMQSQTIEKAAELGIADKVLFTGFLRGADIDRAYQMSDVYVMPSVSEPFGITPLEAMRNETPVVISKQSGVSEVLRHCMKADFWDIDRMANQIVGLLRYPEAHSSLRELGSAEVQKFSWDTPAEKCINAYKLAAGDV